MQLMPFNKFCLSPFQRKTTWNHTQYKTAAMYFVGESKWLEIIDMDERNVVALKGCLTQLNCKQFP